MAKPIIAITGPEKGAFGPRFLVALAVRFYGGIPLQLRPGDENKSLNYQGVVITGGHDIEPVLYAAEPEIETNYDSARDALESSVIHDAIDRKLPLLGICRGAQLLNVCRGGSLHQEIRSQRQKTSNRWTILPLKTLKVESNDDHPHHLTKLELILQRKRLKINSLHNQAIDRVGEKLRVSGRDLDNLVQAIEDPSREFLIGVQWHPEFLLYQSAQRRLFKALINSSSQLISTNAAQ